MSQTISEQFISALKCSSVAAGHTCGWYPHETSENARLRIKVLRITAASGQNTTLKLRFAESSWRALERVKLEGEYVDFETESCDSHGIL